MKKNGNEKQYDVTVIGGGLTGNWWFQFSLKAGFLKKINCVGLIQKKKISKDKKISFIITKIFLTE